MADLGSDSHAQHPDSVATCSGIKLRRGTTLPLASGGRAALPLASGEHVEQGKERQAEETHTSGITSRLLMARSTVANAKGIATQNVQPVFLVRSHDTLIQPLGICPWVGDATSTMGQCHFARHVCAKPQSANQMHDGLTPFLHFLATTVDVGRVG